MLPLSGCDHDMTKRTVAMTNSPSQCSGHVNLVSVDTEWCEYLLLYILLVYILMVCDY